MLPEKKQVLIVDDEPNLRKILAAQLSRDGYDVMTAEDGAEGLTLLRENHIDLVVTDLKMPKVDGMELLREARREAPDLPVILMTASTSAAEQVLSQSNVDYLPKPFELTQLLDLVARYLPPPGAL